MKVIGAGLPHTGTMSMQAALNKLGYPCYHMETIIRTPAHVQPWDDFVNGHAPMDWHTLFRDYEAAVDAPVCFYIEELMQVYPEAKIVLTVRDEERWYNSLIVLRGMMNRLRPLSHIIPKFGRFFSFASTLIHSFIPDPDTHSKEEVIKAFREHNATIQQLVPPERLLVFQVKEGWEPLCNFLGCEVPEGVPFPHLNTGDSTVKAKIRQSFVTGPAKVAVAGVIALGVLLLIKRFWPR